MALPKPSKVEFPTKYTSDGKPYLTISSSSPVHIYLTELYETDIPALIETVNIPSLSHALIAIPQPYTQTDAEWWINHQKSGDSNLPLQALRHSHPGPDGGFIGSASLMPISSSALQEGMADGRLPASGREWERNECEVGYYLHPDWQGKGIMRNAVRGLIDWGLREGGVGDAEVVIRVLEGNGKSRGVVGGMSGWRREAGRDVVIEWPENKGGGRRKLLVWSWVGQGVEE